MDKKKAVIFDFDDVLYPHRDFLLQVYYLFAHFVEFEKGEELAKDLLQTFKSEYETSGAEGIFNRVQVHFPVIGEFFENFERLHYQAQLPLKLHLYPGMENFLSELVKDHKFILILTSGDPLGQLNKIKQVDWKGLEHHLKVYFEDELNFTQTDPMAYLSSELNLSPSEMSYMGQSSAVLKSAKELGVDIWSEEDLLQLKEFKIRSDEQGI